MNPENVIKVSNLLEEYGSAFRNDWSEVDGRSVRDDMDYLSIILLNPFDKINLVEAREKLGLCLKGNQQWIYNCDCCS